MISQLPSILGLLTTLTNPAIAQVLVSRYESLTEIAKAPIEELKTIPGVGDKKAQQIQSAFEFGEGVIERSRIGTTPHGYAGAGRLIIPRGCQGLHR